MKIAALLTGRGNNTLPNKNILPLLGSPLLSYPAKAALAVEDIQRFFVSSDDKKILDIAQRLGYVPILRPKELALPNSQHIDAILHALTVIELQFEFVPDILVVLLANSATIKSEWIHQAISIIQQDSNVSAVVPVQNDQDHHPYRAKRLNTQGSLEPFFDFGDKVISTNRQDLETCYFLCHNFWVLNLQKSLYASGGQKPWVFLGNNIKPIFTQGCFDVHTLDDLAKSEEWLKQNLIPSSE
ncbi:acylneuraminate cytidylyltransferase family protein [Helicobacter equorum]|uniref:acylneuraminate cytidylyltransferase family protein n=1 Tax=Helicobacter equorum TaxID=361872 RepID=UPI000CF1BA86|nr:NTP transferase domain-containing protein [Helicobacter equorum]